MATFKQKGFDCFDKAWCIENSFRPPLVGNDDIASLHVAQSQEHVGLEEDEDEN